MLNSFIYILALRCHRELFVGAVKIAYVCKINLQHCFLSLAMVKSVAQMQFAVYITELRQICSATSVISVMTTQ